MATWTITQGNTLKFSETLKDSAGALITVTGATLVVKVYNGSITLSTKTVTPTSGVFDVEFDPADTLGWPVDILDCISTVTLANGDVYTDIIRTINCLKKR